MKEMDLNEIKQTEINLLKAFKDYCEKNNLRFFLSNGTLLGAIKYNGFIPWDDDIDVMMPREDYDRFVNNFSLDGDIELLCDKTRHNYIFPFAKLMDNTTVIRNQTAVKGYECGVHIDIFPLDFWNDDKSIAQGDAKKLQKQCQNLCFSISRFCKGRSLTRTCVKNIIIAYTRVLGWKHYRKKLDQGIEKCNNKSGQSYCGCLAWTVYGEKEVIPSEAFSKKIDVEFENEKFPAPVGYDIYLRSLYGDYEKDPPLEKQKSHHNFKAYKL